MNNPLEDWTKDKVKEITEGMRKFESGATRDSDIDKLDYEGFLSPLVLERFGEYMNEHRKQADGNLRDSDNWQKGIPIPVYFKSLIRHTVDLWKMYRSDWWDDKKREDLLCAILFNTMGILFELLRARKTPWVGAVAEKHPRVTHCQEYEHPEFGGGGC